MNQPDQAVLIWPVLVQAADMQRSLTYGELEGYTGIAAHGQHTALGLIHDYCKRKDYPILNVIVVSAKTGFPGEGFPEKQMTPTDLLIERARVFAFDWSGKPKPRAEDFATPELKTTA